MNALKSAASLRVIRGRNFTLQKYIPLFSFRKTILPPLQEKLYQSSARTQNLCLVTPMNENQKSVSKFVESKHGLNIDETNNIFSSEIKNT